MKKLTLLVLFTGTAFASSGWIRVESSGFEIWTDAGETKAKEALHSLQQIREIMLAIQPAGAPPSRTLRLLLFHSDSEFARFRPLGNPQAAGLYLAGRQYDYIVVMNGGVPGNRSVLYHEYLHLFSRDRKLPVPHWFDEGMAELFSNVSSTRSEIQVGAPIEAHVRRCSQNRIPTSRRCSHLRATRCSTPRVGRWFVCSQSMLRIALTWIAFLLLSLTGIRMRTRLRKHTENR